MDKFALWSQDAQQLALDIALFRETHPWHPFYCPRPGCDGKAHDEWKWPHARADQRPPSFRKDWLTWLLLGGRGGGKTRSGSELTHRMTDKVPRIALVAPTGPDLRDTIVEGVSGLLATAPPDKMPMWEPSKKRLTWPNGCIAQGFSGEEPDRLRGPQFAFAWLDEPVHIPLIQDVWDNLLFGLRLGRDPRVCCTTTPKPTKWMKALIADKRTVVSRFSTYANLDNLAPTFKATILDRYEGTRLGRQELHGEVLKDVDGALWNVELFDYFEDLFHFDRIVVAVDPAGTANARSDETGIVVIGIAYDTYYVLEDLTGRYSPGAWASRAVKAYEDWEADCIVAEKNYGGDMVKEVLARNGASNVMIRLVTSRRGKALRAEPVVALYEKGLVKHRRGKLALLEDEQVTWIPGFSPSPNRIDALVHGVTELARVRKPVSVGSPASINQRMDYEYGRR